MGIGNSGLGIRGTGIRDMGIGSSGVGMLDTQYAVRDAGCGIRKTGQGTRVARFGEPLVGTKQGVKWICQGAEGERRLLRSWHHSSSGGYQLSSDNGNQIPTGRKKNSDKPQNCSQKRYIVRPRAHGPKPLRTFSPPRSAGPALRSCGFSPENPRRTSPQSTPCRHVADAFKSPQHFIGCDVHPRNQKRRLQHEGEEVKAFYAQFPSGTEVGEDTCPHNLRKMAGSVRFTANPEGRGRIWEKSLR